MSFAPSRYSASAHRASVRGRMVAVGLTVAIHALLLLMLLTLGPEVLRLKQDERNPVSFQLEPPKEKAKRAPAAAKAQVQSKAPPPPKTATVTPPKDPPTPELPFLKLTKEEFASADIASKPSQRTATGAGAGKQGAAVYGPGEGPGGVQLFDADWYRKPTNAELAFYIPKDAPRTGYGLIACQTIENFRVDNCRQIGEGPPGSGFARAVRQAAWQFQVVPPRIDGRPVLGAWVRIRIDYTEGAVTGVR